MVGNQVSANQTLSQHKANLCVMVGNEIDNHGNRIGDGYDASNGDVRTSIRIRSVFVELGK